jgi:outer membrane lipoprotein-sorting protein
MRQSACIFCVSLLTVLVPAWARAQDPSPQEIVDKGIAAHGGLEKLKKTEAANFQGKGTVYVMGQAVEFKGEWWIQPPDKFKNAISLDISGEKMEIVDVLNGDKGWRIKEGLEQLQEEQKNFIKTDLYVKRIAHLVALKDPQYKLTALGGSKIGDAEVWGVKVSHNNHKDVSLFFDKNTGLLLRIQHQGKDPMSGQEALLEINYGNYKDQDGMKIASKISTKKDGNDFVDMTLTDLKLADRLDDKLFDKPAR